VSVQRYVLGSGAVRFRARVKWQGREVATRSFERRMDAVAWEQDQSRRLRRGEWVDPRRGMVPLREVAQAWLRSRSTQKERTQDTDEGNWRRYIEPRFGSRPVASITQAEVTEWIGGLVTGQGLAPATVTRALATFRGILDHGVADERITRNVAAKVRAPRRRSVHEPKALTVEQLRVLAGALGERDGDLALFLGLTGLRWSEVAALRVSDVIEVPGLGVRVQRATTSAGGGGRLVTDSVKNNRARTVPVVEELRPVIDRAIGRRAKAGLLFGSPTGDQLRLSNWRRDSGWSRVTADLGFAPLRIHDLRHTAASVWIAAGADVKVVQRVLGHATASMTVDLYGHLMDRSLWDTADRLGGVLGGTTGASEAGGSTSGAGVVEADGL
jgi:integrase